MTPSIHIALVSDTHTTRDPARAGHGRRFDQAIDAVNAAGVDLVLVAGDLTDGGQAEQYDDFAARAARFTAPARWIPGNHDVGDKHVPGKPGADGGVDAERMALYTQKMGASFWAETFALPPGVGVRVVGVNTSLLGSGLPEEEAQWALLEREMGGEGEARREQMPLIVLVHYPLFDKTPDEPGGEYWNVEPAPRRRFLDLLDAARPNVRVVLSAHLHRPLDNTVDGLRFVGTPPVSFGLPPGRQPEGWTLVTVSADLTERSGGVETRFFVLSEPAG